MESRHSKSIDLKSRSKFKFKYPNATLLNSFIHLRINYGPICDANCYLMCTLGSHSSWFQQFLWASLRILEMKMIFASVN